MGRLRAGGIEQKGKRIHGHGQQCDDCNGEEAIRELNGNGKNTIKSKKKKKKSPDCNANCKLRGHE